MKDEAKYLVRGYCSDTDGGYDDENHADTLKEAKEKAREMMTDEYLRIVESTVPVVFVEIVKSSDGEVVLEFGDRP